MKRFIFILLGIGIFSSCVSEDAEQVIKISDRYSLSIPAFLTKVNNLNEDASLQYQHAWKEFYVIVIDEPKNEFKTAIETYNLADSYSNDLDGYSKLIMDTFDEKGKAELRNTFVNTMPAIVYSLEDRIDGIEIYYAGAIVEGKENFYQIMTWTLADKKLQYQDRMNGILHSFNEL